MREASLIKIKNYLYEHDVDTFLNTDPFKGAYIGLSANKMFCFLAPYIGLQVSKYQSIMSSTIWFTDTPSKIARHLDPRNKFKYRSYSLEIPPWGM
jgi:hypothetical protein